MNTPFHLHGASALITGAGSGIGQATAIAFARAGAKQIFLCARTREKLELTAAHVQEENAATKTVIVAADVTTPQGRAAIAQAIGSNGSLDVLVNNAGLFEGAPIAGTSDELWQRTYDANVAAPFALVRDLLPQISASTLKAIVNISSTLASKPIANAAAYNSSKAALCQLTRSLALELAPRGVRVNCVLPAIVETPMYRGRYATDAAYAAGMKDAATIHPLGRVGRPEDIAHAILFLASGAAAWITGVELPVDGGMLVS